MKILSNKTYRYLVSFKENYDKLIKRKNEEFNNHIHDFECQQRIEWNERWQKMYDEKYDAMEYSNKEKEILENNIISLKKKINILVKNTK